ncbi:MAG: phosphatase PAP2 family protein [Actinobacteria bacterium]|nr:phosphatase PAP2 family protein [Actinomycetota bacterium]
MVDCPESPSLPSNHAATAVAAALTLSRHQPHVRPQAFTAATIVAASRVRVGVHYPSDVIAGAALGALVARMVPLLSWD